MLENTILILHSKKLKLPATCDQATTAPENSVEKMKREDEDCKKIPKPSDTSPTSLNTPVASLNITPALLPTAASALTLRLVNQRNTELPQDLWAYQLTFGTLSRCLWTEHTHILPAPAHCVISVAWLPANCELHVKSFPQYLDLTICASFTRKNSKNLSSDSPNPPCWGFYLTSIWIPVVPAWNRTFFNVKIQFAPADCVTEW